MMIITGGASGVYQVVWGSGGIKGDAKGVPRDQGERPWVGSQRVKGGIRGRPGDQGGHLGGPRGSRGRQWRPGGSTTTFDGSSDDQ